MAVSDYVVHGEIAEVPSASFPVAGEEDLGLVLADLGASGNAGFRIEPGETVLRIRRTDEERDRIRITGEFVCCRKGERHLCVVATHVDGGRRKGQTRQSGGTTSAGVD